MDNSSGHIEAFRANEHAGPPFRRFKLDYYSAGMAETGCGASQCHSTSRMHGI